MVRVPTGQCLSSQLGGCRNLVYNGGRLCEVHKKALENRRTVDKQRRDAKKNR